MKKRISCFIIAMLLVLSASGTVFAVSAKENTGGADTSEESAENISGMTGLTGLNVNELGPGTSLQLIFAALQLQMAETAKQQAMAQMDQIAKIQAEQKLVSAFLNTARQCQSDAESTGEETEMPSDMADYMKENGLSYDTDGNDLLMTSDEWDTAIKSLESRLEKLGTDTQQQMVYIQDFMGKYNSYLLGENIQTPNANQTITNLARGQSMYGDSEVGLAVTGLVVGLVLGCLITLMAQSLRRKKDKA